LKLLIGALTFMTEIPVGDRMTAPKSLDTKLNELPPERRTKIHQRAEELIEQELDLGELRRALSMTQTDLANLMKIGQESISRLERRADPRISTLRAYVEALGGRLTTGVEFPGIGTVSLSGFEHDNGDEDSYVENQNCARR
jgi:DNA-binding XRE family transcriptional regulator